MGLLLKVRDDLAQAMREKDEVKKSTLRLLLAAVRYSEKDIGHSLSDDEVIALIQKEVKVRKETIAGAESASRDDLKAVAQSEIAVLTQYLPQQLTHDELVKLVTETISALGVNSPAETGKVMKTLMPVVKGRASGAEINGVVKECLTLAHGE